MPYACYGALDLGTNACRLLIVKAYESKSGTVRYHPVDIYSRVIHFGQGMTEKERFLTHDAIQRALHVLEICAKRIRYHRVKYLRCVATEACRKAQNAPVVLDSIYRKTQLRFEIISTAEESKLALLGCLDLIDPSIPYGIILDIGGGSTELLLFQQTDSHLLILDSISISVGVLHLDGVNNPAVQKESPDSQGSWFEEAVSSFSLKHNIPDLVQQKKIQMICTSGTMTGLAVLVKKFKTYDRHLVHGLSLSLHELNPIFNWIKQATFEELVNHHCIGLKRANLIVGGSFIVQTILKHLGIQTVRVSNRGVREGIIQDLLMRFPPSFSIQSGENAHSNFNDSGVLHAS